MLNRTQGKSDKRSRLSDVAGLAGVSASTASLVLAGKGDAHRISEETDRRVREAAVSLNYVPSLLHRSVRQGKTGILSFYNSFRNREAGDLYMDRLSAAVEHAGGRKRYNVLVHCFFEPSVQQTFEFLNGGFADGLILFAPTPDDPLLLRLHRAGLPTVVLAPRGGGDLLPTVWDDVESGIEAIADALVDRGHRRIGILAEQPQAWTDLQPREALLRRRLGARGIPQEAIRTVMDDGRDDDALRELLADPAPTALFAWRDKAAYRLLGACERAGVRVPEDVSIVGYDGIQWPSATNHRVTSVRPELEAMADAAVSILDGLIEGEPMASQIRIPPRFVEGTTLKTLPPVKKKKG